MSHKLLNLVVLGLLLTNYAAMTGSAQVRKTAPAKTSQAAPPPAQEPKPPEVKLTQPSKVNDTPATQLSQPVAGPLQVGEKLSYNVSWSNFVSAARYEIEVAGQGAFFGQSGYQLKSYVATVGQVRALFAELDYQYTTYLDSRTLLPFRTDYSVHQGRRNEDNSICFDRQANQVKYNDNSLVPVPADAIDLPSLVFWLRQQDFASVDPKGKKLGTVFGHQLVEIEFFIKGKERVGTQSGNYEATRVDIVARHPEKGEFKVKVWFTDDKQKLPVLMVSRPSFGEIRAELSQVSRRPVAVTLASTSKSTEIATTNPIGVVMEATSVAPSDFEKRLPFTVGEKLNYDISWMNLASIGKMNLVVQQRGALEGKPVFELVGDISTVGAARAIIGLNDTFKSYALADSLMPLRTDSSLLEGKRRRRVVAVYKDNSVRLDNGTHFSVPPGSLDLVSLFYAVRASKLEPGSTATYNFTDSNHRLQTVEVKAVKIEAINSALGQQNTIQLDILNKETRLLLAQAWVTNDARKLPVYVAARLAFGEIRFEIKNVSGTK